MNTVSGIRLQATGDPDVMTSTSWQRPDPGPGEILIHHEAIGVNYIDTYQRSGLYPIPVPGGIGLEAAGIVDAVGTGVTSLAPGDRVAYCSGPPGAYAEAHVVKADRCVKLPDGLASDTIAASLLKGLTVQYLIRRIHRCGPEDTVLFHAAAGGVGQIAVQWLKSLGTTIIATAGGPEKTRIANDLGAHHVIDYNAEDIAPAVRDITDGKGVRVVYDGVGAATWEASLDCLQTRGLMVSFGNASGPVTGVNLGILASKGSLFVTRPTLAHYTATSNELQSSAKDFFDVLESGAVKISAPTVYPLSQAVQAHLALEGRKTTGSLILRP